MIQNSTAFDIQSTTSKQQTFILLIILFQSNNLINQIIYINPIIICIAFSFSYPSKIMLQFFILQNNMSYLQFFITSFTYFIYINKVVILQPYIFYIHTSILSLLFYHNLIQINSHYIFQLRIILYLMFQLIDTYLSVHQVISIINNRKFTQLIQKINSTQNLTKKPSIQQQTIKISQHPKIDHLDQQTHHKPLPQSMIYKIIKKKNNKLHQKHHPPKALSIEYKQLESPAKKKLKKDHSTLNQLQLQGQSQQFSIQASSNNQDCDQDLYRIKIGEQHQAEIPEKRIQIGEYKKSSDKIRLIYSPTKTTPQKFQKLYDRIKQMLGQKVRFSELQLIRYLTEFDHDQKKIIEVIESRLVEIRLKNKQYMKTRLNGGNNNRMI